MAQVAMVMSLDKCIGCQTCTVACKRLWTGDEGMEHMYWNSVVTIPGAGYPRNWEKMGGGWHKGKLSLGRTPARDDYGQPWKFNFKEYLWQGEGDRLRPNPAPRWGPNWEEDKGSGKFPNNYYFYFPRLCNHCSNPACLAACPRKAIYRADKGTILIDQERCRGYRYCIEACPYKIPIYNPAVKKSQKCIFCYPRLERGVAQACAAQCVGRIRFVSYLEDKEGPVYKLVKVHRVALRLHPEYGTEPNVYYIPPLAPPRVNSLGEPLEGERIPDEYLASLFGDDAGQTKRQRIERIKEIRGRLRAGIERKRRGRGSVLMDLLIARRLEDLFQPFSKRPQEL